MNTTRNLPIHTALTPPRFPRDRQMRFLEALSIGGQVRSACRVAAVSPQTAYRARRADPDFRLAWDGAQLAARSHAEEILATRALEGVEDQVFYHGEEVARRRRFDARLLLAHLARLDRLEEEPGAYEIAQDYDAALARFAAGERVWVDPEEEREAEIAAEFEAMREASAAAWRESREEERAAREVAGDAGGDADGDDGEEEGEEALPRTVIRDARGSIAPPGYSVRAVETQGAIPPEPAAGETDGWAYARGRAEGRADGRVRAAGGERVEIMP